jgi:hypothetical protein
LNEWQQAHDTPSTPTGVGGSEVVYIDVPAGQKAPVRFTFFWTATQSWEGKDYQVAVREMPS